MVKLSKITMLMRIIRAGEKCLFWHLYVVRNMTDLLPHVGGTGMSQLKLATDAKWKGSWVHGEWWEWSIFYSIANLFFGQKLLHKTGQYQRNVNNQRLDINVIFSKVSVLCPCINYGENC